MPKFKFVCQVNAAKGKDAEFNAWHSRTHIPEVLAAAGFTRGERLKLVTPDPTEGAKFQYLIIYEGECDDTSKALEALWKSAGGLEQSDTLAPENWMAVFEEIPGAQVEA